MMDPTSTPVYAWQHGAPAGIPADVAAAELAGIYARDGAVTPEAIVEAAKPKGAPLHGAFEWNDGVAANRYREDQARTITRKLTVSYKQHDGAVTAPVRYLVKLVGHPEDQDVEQSDEVKHAIAPHVYIPIKKVMASEDLRARYVHDAYRAAASWRRRYRDIDRFASIFAAIDAMAEEFEPKAV